MLFEYSAGVVVYTCRNGRRIFLTLRRDDFLDIPKGHIEKGESAEQAAIRETKEEANLDVKIDPFFRSEVDYWFMERGKKVKKNLVLFLAKVPPESKVKISHEHHGFEWLDLEEARRKLRYKDQVKTLEKVDDYINRLEAMDALNKEYSQLPSKHNDWGLSGNFVPGEGPLNAKVMLLGQAPGRFEDEQRRPFIGMAGKLLDTMIQRAGMRRKDTYITSIVQFFPPENRLPTDDEAAHCMPFLKRQIQIVKPKLIVVLGNFSAYNLIGMAEVKKNHGMLHHSKEYGCDVLVTLHPAAAVRIKKNTPILEEDFGKIKEIIKSY